MIVAVAAAEQPPEPQALNVKLSEPYQPLAGA